MVITIAEKKRRIVERIKRRSLIKEKRTWYLMELAVHRSLHKVDANLTNEEIEEIMVDVIYDDLFGGK